MEKTSATTMTILSIFEPQYDIYSAFQYPWMTINTLLVLWLMGHGAWSLLDQMFPQFKELSEEKKRNCVTYILQIIVTAYSCIMLCYGGSEIFFQWKDFHEIEHPERLNWLISGLTIVAILYVYELIYRNKFGWPLLIHHVVTLLYMQLTTITLFEIPDIRYARFAIVLAFTATLERTSFIALLLYRFEYYNCAKTFFYIAYIQSTIVKTVAFVVCVVYFSVNRGFVSGDNEYAAWDKFWTWFYLPMIIALYLSQIYAIKILYDLAKRNQHRRDERNETKQERTNECTPSELSDSQGEAQGKGGREEEGGGGYYDDEVISQSTTPVANDVMSQKDIDRFELLELFF